MSKSQDLMYIIFPVGKKNALIVLLIRAVLETSELSKISPITAATCTGLRLESFIPRSRIHSYKTLTIFVFYEGNPVHNMQQNFFHLRPPCYMKRTNIYDCVHEKSNNVIKLTSP